MIGKPAGERDTLGRLLAALACLTAGVAGAVFAFTAYGATDYARTDMRAPVEIGWLAPAGLDVAAIAAIAAAWALAELGAPWQVRAYPWVVFVVASAGSIGANYAHARSRHLNFSGSVGVACAPILLMLLSHLFVVVRRHYVMHRDKIRTTTPPAPDVAPIAPTTLAPVVVAPSRPVVSLAGVAVVRPLSSPVVPIATPTTRRRTTTATTPTDDIRRQAARRRVAAGEAVAAVARDMFPDDKPDTRNARVRRWCADLPARDQRKEA